MIKRVQREREQKKMNKGKKNWIKTTRINDRIIYMSADPRQAESKPQALSESESFCVWDCATPPKFVDDLCWLSPRCGTEFRLCLWGWGVDWELLSGWLDTGSSRDDVKSWARRLRRFFIGAYFGGGITLWSVWVRRKD